MFCGKLLKKRFAAQSKSREALISGVASPESSRKGDLQGGEVPTL